MENILKELYLGILIFTITSYCQEDCHCPTVVYLTFGWKSKIPCRCDHFSLVSWYSSKEDYDDRGSPFITYDKSETRGTGKDSGQFDLEMDGSLIINNVSMIIHGMEYFSVFLRYTEGQTVKNRVKVEVIVPPDPLYPVLNGHMNHQYLYLDMERQGTLYCSMEGVHPKVNLSITVIDQGQQGVYLEQGDVKYSSNEDSTYNVKVTYNYTADLSVQTSVLQCKVPGELGQHFSEVTTAEISFPLDEKAFPVIDGGIAPEHIYLEKNRTGEIECSIRSSDPETSLVWRVIDPFSEDKIRFDNCLLRALPGGDTFIVSSKCSYVVEGEDVDRVTVQCQVTGGTGHQYQNATKVELFFPKKAPTSLTPVIDGCNGKHDICMLKVQSEGELTCRVKNIHQSVELWWNLIDGHQWQVSSGKMEVDRDFITRSFQYAVKTSQMILIAECVTVDAADDRIPEVSSRVVLVTEGDKMSRHCAPAATNWLTLFFVIAFGLTGIILWYFNRKLCKESVMKHQSYPSPSDVPLLNHPEESVMKHQSYLSPSDVPLLNHLEESVMKHRRYPSASDILLPRCSYPEESVMKHRRYPSASDILLPRCSYPGMSVMKHQSYPSPSDVLLPRCSYPEVSVMKHRHYPSTSDVPLLNHLEESVMKHRRYPSASDVLLPRCSYPEVSVMKHRRYPFSSEVYLPRCSYPEVSVMKHRHYPFTNDVLLPRCSYPEVSVMKHRRYPPPSDVPLPSCSYPENTV